MGLLLPERNAGVVSILHSRQHGVSTRTREVRERGGVLLPRRGRAVRARAGGPAREGVSRECTGGWRDLPADARWATGIGRRWSGRTRPLSVALGGRHDPLSRISASAH